ncbi:MAG: tRNA (guanosine(37)-N1)-methyltransferase TrmD [Candidatus Omnitrophica bacterium]|nr:tRNA (guanosine(37)-N1)-methyltransferase TrmD [Candidatus Omnitrophota bacterium]
MRIDILTIFPEMFEPILDESIVRRAKDKGLVKIAVHNLRDYSDDKHRKVDDRPFGGGPGMVFKPEPVFKAVGYIKSKIKNQKSKVIMLTPQGKVLNQKLAKELSKSKNLILICGHYEGIDERVRVKLVDEEVSIGDYVLTGGELPAMVLVDAVVRLVKGVLGDENSSQSDSFCDGLLEYPQYTRPADFKGMKVPKVLLSGDHQKIAKWRKEQALKVTRKKRPDLMK